MSEYLSPKFGIEWTNPCVEGIGNDREWRLKEDFIVKWFENGRLHRITVKAGTLTDGASVPQLAWSLGFLPTGTAFGASVIHDMAYECRGQWSLNPSAVCEYRDPTSGLWLPESYQWTREQCDHYFYEFMLAGNTEEWKAWIMWKSVRIFGRFAW